MPVWWRVNFNSNHKNPRAARPQGVMRFGSRIVRGKYSHHNNIAFVPRNQQAREALSYSQNIPRLNWIKLGEGIPMSYNLHTRARPTIGLSEFTDKVVSQRLASDPQSSSRDGPSKHVLQQVAFGASWERVRGTAARNRAEQVRHDRRFRGHLEGTERGEYDRFWRRQLRSKKLDQRALDKAGGEVDAAAKLGVSVSESGVYDAATQGAVGGTTTNPDGSTADAGGGAGGGSGSDAAPVSEYDTTTIEGMQSAARGTVAVDTDHLAKRAALAAARGKRVAVAAEREERAAARKLELVDAAREQPEWVEEAAEESVAQRRRRVVKRRKAKRRGGSEEVGGWVDEDEVDVLRGTGGDREAEGGSGECVPRGEDGGVKLRRRKTSLGRAARRAAKAAAEASKVVAPLPLEEVWAVKVTTTTPITLHQWLERRFAWLDVRERRRSLRAGEMCVRSHDGTIKAHLRSPGKTEVRAAPLKGASKMARRTFVRRVNALRGVQEYAVSFALVGPLDFEKIRTVALPHAAYVLKGGSNLGEVGGALHALGVGGDRYIRRTGDLEAVLRAIVHICEGALASPSGGGAKSDGDEVTDEFGVDAEALGYGSTHGDAFSVAAGGGAVDGEGAEGEAGTGGSSTVDGTRNVKIGARSVVVRGGDYVCVPVVWRAQYEKWTAAKESGASTDPRHVKDVEKIVTMAYETTEPEKVFSPAQLDNIFGRVLLNTDDVIAWNKPPGMGVLELKRVARALRIDEDRVPSLFVDKVDKDASGVVLFAKTPSAFRRLREWFRRPRDIEGIQGNPRGEAPKLYERQTNSVPREVWLGVTVERPFPPRGRVSTPLLPLPRSFGDRAHRVQTVESEFMIRRHRLPRDMQRLYTRDGLKAMRAVTEYRTINHFGNVLGLVAFYPYTSVADQIRVHACETMLRPLLGDWRYAPDKNRWALGGLDGMPVVEHTASSKLLSPQFQKKLARKTRVSVSAGEYDFDEEDDASDTDVEDQGGTTGRDVEEVGEVGGGEVQEGSAGLSRQARWKALRQSRRTKGPRVTDDAVSAAYYASPETASPGSWKRKVPLHLHCRKMELPFPARNGKGPSPREIVYAPLPVHMRVLFEQAGWSTSIDDPHVGNYGGYFAPHYENPMLMQ